MKIGQRLIWWLLLLLFSWCGCAHEAHPVKLSVECKYPSNPSFSYPGVIQHADLAVLDAIWLMPDGGIEIQ